MATEVTVRIRDNPLGQAFFIQQEEWDLCLSEIRAILSAQEIETPVEYRFLSGNGNVLSLVSEKTMTFRDVVEKEPFAEVKKDDTSLQSAEERIAPQVNLVAVVESSESTANQHSETPCPFLNKFPCLAGVKDTLPCMRNVLNVHTLLKVAFILTCLLFLMIFVLTLFLHLIFGFGAVGSYAGHGIFSIPPFHHQHTAGSADHEALTSLKVKLTEMEVASRFEIQSLKQKLDELEDMYLSQFKELEAVRKELEAAKANQSGLEKRLVQQTEGFEGRLLSVEDSMLERWRPQHGDSTVGPEALEEQAAVPVTTATDDSLKEEDANSDSGFSQLEEEGEQMKKQKTKEDKKKNKKDKGKKKEKKNKKQ